MINKVVIKSIYKHILWNLSYNMENIHQLCEMDLDKNGALIYSIKISIWIAGMKLLIKYPWETIFYLGFDSPN